MSDSNNTPIEEDLTFKVHVDQHDAYITLGGETIFRIYERFIWDPELWLANLFAMNYAD